MYFPRTLSQLTRFQLEERDSIRRLESLEHQSEQVMKALSDARDVDGLRDDASKERFSAIDKTLRDIQRGVQLVRDKQVCTKVSQ